MSRVNQFLRDFRDYMLRVRRIDREALASIYLSGEGIEIGALTTPLKVPLSAKVRYIDRMPEEDLRKQYPELRSKKLVHLDIIDDGEMLKTVEDTSQDFVIANHFLEHCENPINAIVNFIRVLRDNGIIYLSIPDKRFSFDKERQATSFEHLMQDYKNGSAISRSAHFRDWVVNVEHKKTENEIQHRISELISMNCSIHYHVWATIDMINFLGSLQERLDLPIEVEAFAKNREEMIFILRKE